MPRPQTFLGMKEISNRINEANKLLFQLASAYNASYIVKRIEYNEKIYEAVEKLEAFVRKAEEALIEQLTRDSASLKNMIEKQPHLAEAGLKLIERAEHILEEMSAKAHYFSEEIRHERLIGRHAKKGKRFVGIEKRMISKQLARTKEKATAPKKQGEIIPLHQQQKQPKQEQKKSA